MTANELSRFWQALLEPLDQEAEEFLRSELIELERLHSTRRKLSDSDFALLERRRTLASETLKNSSLDLSLWRTAEAHMRAFAATSQRFTSKTLCEWNALLRGQQLSNYRGGDLLGDFAPYLSFEYIDESIERLMDLLEGDFISDHHPLIRAARLYRGFISIHPFADANGRTGRLLADFILLRAGYPPMVASSPRDAVCAFYTQGEGFSIGHAVLLMVESAHSVYEQVGP